MIGGEIDQKIAPCRRPAALWQLSERRPRSFRLQAEAAMIALRELSKPSGKPEATHFRCEQDDQSGRRVILGRESWPGSRNIRSTAAAKAGTSSDRSPIAARVRHRTNRQEVPCRTTGPNGESAVAGRQPGDRRRRRVREQFDALSGNRLECGPALGHFSHLDLERLVRKRQVIHRVSTDVHARQPGECVHLRRHHGTTVCRHVDVDSTPSAQPLSQAIALLERGMDQERVQPRMGDLAIRSADEREPCRSTVEVDFQRSARAAPAPRARSKASHQYSPGLSATGWSRRRSPALRISTAAARPPSGYRGSRRRK